MKQLKQLALVVGLAGIGLLSGMDLARAQGDIQTREVMKAKLGHAQAVLEGMATEDFEKVRVSAERISALSQAAGWHARQTPEYELFTTEFRRRADALVKEAIRENTDGVAVAYVQMTFSCVSCHKYMRGKKAAALAPAESGL